MSVTFIPRATDREIADLHEAVRVSCGCGDNGRCGACTMLATDQRAVNGLIYVRRTQVARLLREEFLQTAEFGAFDAHHQED